MVFRNPDLMNPPSNPSLFVRAAQEFGGTEKFIAALPCARQTYFDMKRRGWVGEKWLPGFVEVSGIPAWEWRPDLDVLFHRPQPTRKESIGRQTLYDWLGALK